MSKQIGDYRFKYCHDVEQPGRIYIEQQPSYIGRATDSHSTHRLNSGNGAPPHICIKEGHKPGTLAEAQKLARDGGGDTERYRRS